MLKIILKKSEKINRHYNLFAHNVSSDCNTQLGLMTHLINDKILTDMLTKKDINGEYPVGSVDNISIYYNLFDTQDFYLSFYNTIFDDYWLDICEKKYGQSDFVFDEEIPVLKFSKANIEEVLRSWEKLKNFDH